MEETDITMNRDEERHRELSSNSNSYCMDTRADCTKEEQGAKYNKAEKITRRRWKPRQSRKDHKRSRGMVDHTFDKDTVAERCKCTQKGGDGPVEEHNNNQHESPERQERREAKYSCF